MSKHDPSAVLRQMQDFAGRAVELGQAGSRSRLESDWLYQFAAESTVELIGEAATRLPEDLRQRHAQIPWREIIGMRNRIIHGYDAVDADVVWDVLAHHAPSLVEQLPAIISCEEA
jgi:uncharacterized protein with HEPN domain